MPPTEEPGALWRNAERRRARFEANAANYDRYRPGYPRSIFDDLVAIAQLRPGDLVVEVGSGTGIATVPLVDRGLAVTCLEPGPAMSALAQAKVAGRPGVTFIPSRFEDWDAPAGHAAAIVAANAWHWVEPAVGYRQAATVLRPAGYLCLIFHRLLSTGPPGFDDELLELREALIPPTPSDRAAMAFVREKVWSEDVEASGLFTYVTSTAHGFSRELSATEFVKVADTYGTNSQLDPEQLARFNREVIALIDHSYGGAVSKREEAILTVGRRRDP